MGVPLCSSDSRDYRTDLERTYVVTLLGVFVVVFLWLFAVMPIEGPDVRPLLEAPTAVTGQKAPTTERDIFVSIDVRGHLFLQGNPVSGVELAARLRVNEPSQGQRQVFIRVDRNAPFGAVREAVRAAQHANQRHLIFLVRPPRSAYETNAAM